METGYLLCILIISIVVSLSSPALASEDNTTINITRCGELCMQESSPVKFCAQLTSDGKCECDFEKVLTPGGTCTCLNPHHSVNDANQCVCDLGKCAKPDLMTGCKIKETKTDCCPEYDCEECPDDSYRSNHTQDDKCLCYPCKMADCRNESMIIIRKGNQKPGTCCDLYQCDVFDRKSCVIEGKNISDGESLMSGCKLYSCNNGIVFHKLLEDCEKKFCFSNDQVYENFQSWMEDECTNCTCVNGVKKCMAHFCKDLPSATIHPAPINPATNHPADNHPTIHPTIHSNIHPAMHPATDYPPTNYPAKGQDCPSMECGKICPFGYKVNRRGCEMCKCKQPDVKTMQDILKDLNCTAEGCAVLHGVTSVCGERKDNRSVEQCPKCPDSQASSLWPSILLTSTATLSLVCLALLYLLCRRRADCNLHDVPASHSADKYQHIPLYDANLNQAMLLSATKQEVKR